MSCLDVPLLCRAHSPTLGGIVFGDEFNGFDSVAASSPTTAGINSNLLYQHLSSISKTLVVPSSAQQPFLRNIRLAELEAAK